MLRPEHFSSSSKFSRKDALEDRACLAIGCPAACLDDAGISTEEGEKKASPDHTRCLELAFARSGGKQRLAAAMLTVVTVHPRGH